MITFGVPVIVAVLMFSMMFGLALRYKWIDESIDTGPYVPGSMTVVLSPDGGSFQMTYSVPGAGLTYATNSSGTWVKEQLTQNAVSKASIFVDSLDAVHIAAINESDGGVLYLNQYKGKWNSSVVDTGADPDGGCSLAIDTKGAAHIVYSKLQTTPQRVPQGGLMVWQNYTQPSLKYANGKEGNFTVTELRPAAPRTNLTYSMNGCDLFVQEKGSRMYPFIVYSLGNSAIELFNKTSSGTKWIETVLANAASNQSGLSIKRDANNTLHIYYLARGAGTLAFVAHYENTGANQTFVRDTTPKAFLVGSSPIMTAGMDWGRKLHMLVSDGLGKTSYIVGSWNKTYRVQELNPKITNASMLMLVDMSGFIYAAVDGPATSVVTNNLTVWDQLELDGAVTIVTGVGLAGCIAFIGFMYLRSRRPRPA